MLKFTLYLSPNIVKLVVLSCACKRPRFDLGREDPLEEGVATHASILAWRIPWTEEPGGLQCMGLHRVGHG